VSELICSDFRPDNGQPLGSNRESGCRAARVFLYIGCVGSVCPNYSNPIPTFDPTLVGNVIGLSITETTSVEGQLIRLAQVRAGRVGDGFLFFFFFFDMSTQEKGEEGFELVISALLGMVYSRLSYLGDGWFLNSPK
jgi:hypothetical protein